MLNALLFETKVVTKQHNAKGYTRNCEIKHTRKQIKRCGNQGRIQGVATIAFATVRFS